MDTREPIQRRLACLGDPSRFRILTSLQAGRLCVSELARAVRLSQSCTTRHLQALSAVGVVRPEREGRRVVYVIRQDDPDVAGLVRWLGNAGAASAPSATGAGAGPARRSRPARSMPAAPAPARREKPASPAAAAPIEPPPVSSDAATLTDPSPAREVAPDDEPAASDRRWRRAQDLEDFLL